LKLGLAILGTLLNSSHSYQFFLFLFGRLGNTQLQMAPVQVWMNQKVLCAKLNTGAYADHQILRASTLFTALQ
jgi:hypothetical protein